MPGYKGHMAGGVFFFILALMILLPVAVAPLTLLEWFFFAILGSLFPDVDTKSKGQRVFYGIFFLAAAFLLVNHRFKMLAWLSIVSLLPLLVNHRGLFHRLWFLIMLTGGSAYAFYVFCPHACHRILWDAGFFLLGILSHLWLDFGVRRMLRIR